ncbi:MAG: thioredoxin domain-containing protein [Tuberibacillus sp.]
MPSNNKPNRLAAEKSPYLLQHAYNPVDWYPWGDEAFEKAKRENKPVFVSIGYSTCHWCHVMAHESFEDEEVAGLLNDHFVSIKVDREERPDIDSIYMTVCQALTGHGGWPLSVFLTPDQKPFYAGTYFPKESRYGQPGFIDVLMSIASQYQKDQEKILKSGDQIVHALNEAKSETSSIHKEIIDHCFEHFEQSFDSEYGGFGHAPKFPAPHQLLFLLRYARLYKNDRALEMVEKTLEGIANGGIHDHIGGGFARYSVDREWLVPHFEKMLYDQATLMLAYTEAWQNTKNPRWEYVVEGIYNYLVRDMQDEKGGFYSAEDADSEGIEGKFYVWKPEDIFAVLDEHDAGLYCHVYDITKKGNFEGASIPNLIGASLSTTAEEQQMTEDALREKLAELEYKLFCERETRIHPHKDDKILTSWNALMIATLAQAGRVFQKEKYIKTAERAFRFIHHTMFQDGELHARYREGDVKFKAFLDDYSYLMWACDALYEATFNPEYIKKMKIYADQMIDRFWDGEHFGFYLNQNDVSLVMRPKDVYDGAMPSGNSAAAMMLFKLARRTGQIDYETYVDKMFNTFGSEVNRYPMGYTWLLTTYLLALRGTKELVVLPKDELSKSLPDPLTTDYLPEVVTLYGNKANLASIASFTKDFNMLNDQTTYYLCEHFSCRQPTNDAEEIIAQLKK